MTHPEPKSARFITAQALARLDPYKGYASAVLNDLLNQTDHPAAATELTFGTVRNRNAVDLVFSKFAEKDVNRVQPKILSTIRLGIYELIYAPQTPQYAIVNSAVENTRAIAGKKQTAFVNAVLRQVSRHITDRQVQLDRAPARQTLPQNSDTGCQFDTDILPDPKKSPSQYLSSAFSLPQWLTDKWLDQFGFKKTTDLCLASNRRPSIYLRPNPLKVTPQKLAEMLTAVEVDFELLEDIPMLRLKSPKSPDRLPGFDQGLFTVQDPSSSAVIKSLPLQAGQTILDLCAAPGSKTTQITEATEDKAKIIATDINHDRLERLKENIQRLGLNSIQIVDYRSIEKSDKKFDWVLVDVPCSNTGVLAKRPEARFRVTPKAVTNLAKIQLSLLEKASSLIKPGGILIYSTCSILAEENSHLIKQFLHNHPDMSVKSQTLTLPCDKTPDRDGGYFAVIS